MNEAELKAAHEALWNYLSENPDERKEDWPGWNSKNDLYGEIFEDYNACFACYYDNMQDGMFCCDDCPLQIAKCGNEKSPWKKWCRAGSEKTRKKYAAMIRDAWREIPVSE
jgi:hypothetical protein